MSGQNTRERERISLALGTAQSETHRPLLFTLTHRRPLNLVRACAGGGGGGGGATATSLGCVEEEMHGEIERQKDRQHGKRKMATLHGVRLEFS